MGLTLVTPPTAMPVTIQEAREQVGLHSTDTAYDAQINGYIASATDDLDGPDGKLGCALMPQTWAYSLDAFTDTIELPLGPVTEITSVKYYDADGVQQTVDAEFYTSDLSGTRPWVVLNGGYSWPATLDGINAVTIQFKAGRGAPPAVKQAILLQIDHWFQPIGPNNTVEAFERAYHGLIGTKRRVFL